VGEAPEVWWPAQGRGEPRYDTLLEALASTPGGRQAILKGYFDPPPDAGGAVQPTEAHHALAGLCASGRVKVILTTNFDRLIERALDQAGIPPQVIATSLDVEGMTPLAHAAASVIKLHGDYATSAMRNTAQELAAFPEEFEGLLSRVLDEYGLLVVGWSADYDVALAQAIARCPSRRYPTYWASFRGLLTEPARRLIAARGASEVDTAGADEFLVDLALRIERLDQLAVRRVRPMPLRTYSSPPHHSSPPQGWTLLPLLQLRAVAAAAATIDSCGYIAPLQREGIYAALGTTPLTDRLRSLSLTTAAAAAAASADMARPATSQAITAWEPTPGGHQSTEHASYRLGGDGSSDVCALVTINLPNVGIQGGSVTFAVDVGISIDRPLELAEVALLLREGLVLVTTLLPFAIADILPNDSSASHAEVHLLAAATDGQNQARSNGPLERVNLSVLGQPTRDFGQSMGFAARLGGPLAEREAAELVLEALQYMTLAAGYLDPRPGLDDLRRELGMGDAPDAWSRRTESA
jgi:hypothetical protein